MSQERNLAGSRRRRSFAALLSYLLALMGLGVLTWLAVASLQLRFAELASARNLLARMELAGRPVAAPGAEAPAMSGSPFLEGQTVSIAEAALQQRVGGAVAAAGGNVLSSQVEPEGGETRKDYLTLTASCEIDQPGLQPLLYDLEAGMPFLFIDQLVLQAPQAVGGAEAGRLRLLITVSGRWQGAK